MATWGLELRSPVGAPSRKYTWPLFFGSTRVGKTKDRHDRATEIVETIKWVCEDYQELWEWDVLGQCIQNCDTKSYESMKYLCDRYNTAIEEIIETNGIRQEREFPSNELLKHILLQVYNAAVTDPEKLNQYEPFSPEVYGETSYDLISSMIKKLELTEHDTFIDLGSGVGQVVLQVAASTPVRICYGIEKADVPAAYAEDMDSEFKFWMSWYGKTHRPYKLVKGDFLSTEKSISDKVNQSSIIFVNNFAFGPTLDHQLKLIFAELKDGTRIVSSKAYSSMNFRTTERNLNDIGAIMYSQLLFKKPIKEGVSWTNKGVEYFLQLIDRAKLQRHFEENNGKAKNGNGNGKGRDQEPNSTSSRGRTSRAPARRNVRTPASFYSEDSDESVIGPTTRRQWSDYVSRSNGKSSKENSEEDTQSSRSKTSSSSQSPKLNGSPGRKPKQRAENKMEEWKPTQSPGLSGQKRPRAQQENRSQRARATSPDIIYGNRSHAGLPRKDSGRESPNTWRNQVSYNFDKIFSFAHAVDRQIKKQRESLFPALESAGQTVSVEDRHTKCSKWLDTHVTQRYDAFGLRVPRTPSPSHIITDDDEPEIDEDSFYVPRRHRRDFYGREVEIDVPNFIEFKPDGPNEPDPPVLDTWQLHFKKRFTNMTFDQTNIIIVPSVAASSNSSNLSPDTTSHLKDATSQRQYFGKTPVGNPSLTGKPDEVEHRRKHKSSKRRHSRHADDRHDHSHKSGYEHEPSGHKQHRHRSHSKREKHRSLNEMVALQELQVHPEFSEQIPIEQG